MATATGDVSSRASHLSSAEVAGIGVGAAFGGMSLFAAICAFFVARRKRSSTRNASSTSSARPTIKRKASELPGYNDEAKEADFTYSPLSRRGLTRTLSGDTAGNGVSPIDTVITPGEQDELRQVRERLKRMRNELRVLEERERAELDAGMAGGRLTELPGNDDWAKDEKGLLE